MIVYSGKVIKVEGNQIWLAFEKNANAPIRVSFSKEFEKKVEPGDQYLVSGELKNENEIFIYSYLDPVKISSDKDINNVFVVGRLGKDPEIKYFDDGNNVVNISLATNGVKQDPDWLFCEAWQKTAEIIANYCQKGSQIGFCGYLKSKKAANERIYHTVVGNKVLLLSSNNHETQKPEPEEEQEGLPF